MENHWITVETILLFFGIVIAWTLNGLSVFMKYWIFYPYGWYHFTVHYGIFPIDFSNGYTFFISVGVMMVISFGLFFLLAGFYAFALISFIFKKYNLTRVGYLIVSIISTLDALLQLASFIVMAICLQFPGFFDYHNAYNTTIGACEYLALASCIFNILIIPVAIHLWRTDFEMGKSVGGRQWEENQG